MTKKQTRLKTREIEKIPRTPHLFPELVAALSQLCFVEDVPRKADLIFVFGSNVQQADIAAVVCQLLKENISKKVIITGGTADYENSYFEPAAESRQILSHIICSDFPDT